MVVSLLARGPVGGDPTERTFGDKEISDLTGENDVVLGDGGISGNGGGSCTIRAGETIPGDGADRGSGCVTASDDGCSGGGTKCSVSSNVVTLGVLLVVYFCHIQMVTHQGGDPS